MSQHTESLLLCLTSPLAAPPAAPVPPAATVPPFVLLVVLPDVLLFVLPGILLPGVPMCDMSTWMVSSAPTWRLVVEWLVVVSWLVGCIVGGW